METYTMTDEQWKQINTALNVAISVCLLHKREFMEQMVDAGAVMDDIANGQPEVKE